MKDYKVSYGQFVTGDWPNTAAKNASGPSASDGTPFTKELIDDFWGGREDLMVRAGLTPNGVTEANGTSQFVQALRRGAGLPPGLIFSSALNVATLATCRLLVLAGQVITVASYVELVAAVYCGDAANPTAPGFYRTSDAGGSTRSTTGAYMVLPDARGLFARGMGSNSRIFPADAAYVFAGLSAPGGLQTDAMLGHRHARQPGGLSERILSGGAGAATFGGGSYLLSIGITETGNPVTDGEHGAPRIGYENRPASFSVQWVISY